MSQNKQSTNKWAIERMRASVNVLLKKAGTDSELVKVLSDLLWVVDHQQDQLERLPEEIKRIVEQALVDHARGDDVVMVNEDCRQALKDYRTEPAT